MSSHPFTDNKYTRWYFRLIDRVRANPHSEGTYTERHHIVPRSLGGTNEDLNLISLSGRQHFVAHELLMLMTEGQAHQKMTFAWTVMAHGHTSDKYQITALEYERVRVLHAEAIRVLHTGRKRSEETKQRIREAAARPETRKRRSEAARLSNARPETKQRIRKALKIVNNRPETRKRRSEAARLSNARPETKQRQREAAKIVWARPEVKAKRSESAKIANNRPDVKRRKSEAAKITQNRPDVKQRKSDAQKGKPKRCSVCHELGHNRRFCHNREVPQ